MPAPYPDQFSRWLFAHTAACAKADLTKSALTPDRSELNTDVAQPTIFVLVSLGCTLMIQQGMPITEETLMSLLHQQALTVAERHPAGEVTIWNFVEHLVRAVLSF